MTREAMKQALEALIEVTGWQWAGPMRVMDEVEDAITALRQALEQPADEIDWKDQYEKQKRRAEMWVAKYEKDIGPVEMAVPMQQPADEPVAWATMLGSYSHVSWGKDRPDYPIRYEVPLYTRPQPAAQWVGLTMKDKHEYMAQDLGGSRLDAMDWAEKRLREKNA